METYITLLIHFGKGRQYIYSVILWRVRATIVAVDKQYVLHMLSVCL